MKWILALALFAPPAANAWNVNGLPYMVYQSQPQPPEPQPTYSEQYNAGYMDAYQNAHGYAGTSTYNAQAYQDGYQAAWRAEHRQ